jgi:Nucleotidyl transferase AbiEii toxin, Type IV TA system
MNLALQIDQFVARGFSQDRAQAVVLLRESAILLFQAFPESFLLYGGANLILFHDSLRTSLDLDLLTQGSAIPSAGELVKILSDGLQGLAKLLDLAPISIRVRIDRPEASKFEVFGKDGTTLFTVDLGGLGTVLQSGVAKRSLEAVSHNATATIRYVSADHLLLQKAEAFLFRRSVKVRDAYDIRLLQASGADLHANLNEHLSDAMAMREIDSDEILARIAQVDSKLCRFQLRDTLPEAEYDALERADFQPLRDALRKLFQRWL